jgi:shikimate kinase
MGCGKTTVGRPLAEDLGWCFVDIDSEIEAQERKTITQIFAERGEAGFRDLETAMIRRHVSRIEAGNPCVVALGGGAFIQPRNWELIENNGITLWLDCPFEVIRKRLDGDETRPLAAKGADLSRLFQDRCQVYARADFRIPIHSDDPSEIARDILALPIF